MPSLKRESLDKDSDASEKWLAIAPRFRFEEQPNVLSPGSFGFRYLMVMAYIAFGVLPDAAAPQGIQKE